MAEELKSLIERIHQDAVEKARREADALLAAAREEAGRIREEGRREAEAALKKAEDEAARLAERGRKGLEQAARDVLILVGQSLSRAVEQFAAARVKAEFAPDFLRQMILKVLTAYCDGKGSCDDIDLLVAEKDQKEIVAFFMNEFRTALEKGVDIHASADVLSGFRVVMAGTHVEHDFTGEAVASAMARLLRPHLAELVASAANPPPPA